MAASKRTEKLLRQDLSHVIHPFTTIGGAAEPIFEEGHGIMLKDTDGNEYMDFSSGLIVVNVGYSREEIAEAVYASASESFRLRAFANSWIASSKVNGDNETAVLLYLIAFRFLGIPRLELTFRFPKAIPVLDPYSHI